MIPSYLQRPVSAGEEPLGKLYPVKKNDKIIEWIVEGDAGMVQVVKRLFPGSTSKGRGMCRFPHSKRNSENLNWIMIRYPLVIEDMKAWDDAYKEAVDHAVRIRAFNNRPSKHIPPAEFVGELMEFQEEGLSYLIGAERALLADEMGLGKTIQALAYISSQKAYPALIVAPNHLIKNWNQEIKKFIKLPGYGQQSFAGTEEESIHIIKGLRPYELPDADIYLIHYGLLRGWKNTLPEYDFKVVVFDEIQELRHTGTEKYSSASLIGEKVPRCFGLSGTPIYNRGGEMWAVMNIIEFHCLGDWDSFTREWCYGYGNDIVVNPEALGDYLRREGLMLRRTKDQVLKELPPKRRVVQTIDFDTGTYSKLIQDAISKAKSIESINDHFERGRMTREIVNESRQAMGIAKAPYVVNFVKMLLEAGESILIFAYHHAVFDIYLEELESYKPAIITGRQNAEEKDNAVKSFMGEKTNVCMISLRAAAGLNLQRATAVVFGELDWSPAIHSQAEDRAHRIGQTDSILCYYLTADEGPDEVIQEFLGLKKAQFVGLMGDKIETEEDKAIAQAVATEHMGKIVDILKKK